MLKKVCKRGCNLYSKVLLSKHGQRKNVIETVGLAAAATYTTCVKVSYRGQRWEHEFKPVGLVTNLVKIQRKKCTKPFLLPLAKAEARRKTLK